MAYGSIYLIRNKRNDKVYVGQTRQSVDVRWGQHIHKARRKNTPFANAIKKWGSDSFSVIPLTTAQDKTSLDLKERLLIRAYKSLNRIHGYNCQDGGVRGAVSEETRRKIGVSNAISQRGKKLSIETKAKMSERLRREHANGSRKPISVDARLKISQANKRRVASSETRAKISALFKGKKKSPESIAKRSATMIAKRDQRCVDSLSTYKV